MPYRQFSPHEAPERGPGKYDRAKTAKERAEERRVRLLLSAGAVFAEQGLAGASVQRICDHASVSRQTFYEHFGDLRGALLAVYDYAVGVAFGTIERAVRSTDDPTEKLERGVGTFFAALEASPDLARVVSREVVALGPDGASRKEATLSRYAALIMEGVAEAYARGLVRRAPDETTAYTLVGGIDALASRAIHRGETRRLVEQTPDVVRMVLAAFGGSPPRVEP